MTHTKPLVLVDATSYLYRAFYAMPPLTNSQGIPTGAVYGVVNMVRKLLAEQKPEHIALVFDAKGKTFRDDLYAQYKAHRPRMPDDLSVQTAPLHAIIHAMGLPLLAVDGVEADDVIGTLACQAAERGMHVLIYTGDKDLAQLVNAQVTLINTMNNSVLDVPGVIQKFGIPAERIVDYLALVGDSVDNIPGVPKVGPTTALKWLKQYGTLDNIIEHAGEIGGKVGENLRAALAQLPLSRSLLTVKCDVVLDVTPLDLRPRPPDVEALRELYKKLEFKAWLAQTPLKPAVAIVMAVSETVEIEVRGASAPSYDTIITPEQFDVWLTKLSQPEFVCLDVQTTSLDYMQAQIVGIAFALPGPSDGVAAAYIPLAHDYPNAPVQLARDQVLERLRPLLEDPHCTKLGHDIKFAFHVLANHGITLAGARFDTMLESYVLDSTATRHDVDSLAVNYLDGRANTLESIAGKGVRQLAFNQIAIEAASVHAAEQAALIMRLHLVLWPQVNALESLQRLFTDMEMPLALVLARIERNGVGIDPEMLHRQSEELAMRMDELEQQAHVLAGQPFNLGSPAQIQEILYDKLGLPVLQKTPKGQPSTAEPVLQELALDYPLPKLILEHRAMSKLKSTYTDSLPERINPATARVHTCYQQAVAATGRLSSTNPNLQNIPIRSAAGRRIRQAFVAAPGYKILAADYSQIELRIMAHLSGDAKLLRAFADADDVHKITAAEVFGVAPDQVTPDQRRTAKTTNFALIYGMSSFGLARQLGIDRLAAQQYVARYFARYPGVKIYMDGSRAKARELGYVETILGRRLYVPHINDRNAQRRQYAERTAINAPLQGTAADIIKLAMLRVDAWLGASGVDVRMIMQVHDELVFEVAEDSVDKARETIRNCMTAESILAVPLVVDIGVGNNWDEAH
ncbi:MAG: DNA polymerase I [Gammaproteobacteria bacterium]